MALIGTTTFDDGADKYLELSNEEWGRAIAILGDWNKLRVGMMCAIVPDGTNNLLGAQMRFGMSTSKSDHLGSLSANLWYGITFASNGITLLGGTLTYNAASGFPWFEANLVGCVRSLDSVLSGVEAAGDYAIPATTGSTLRRWPVVVEFEKSGTNLIVVGWGVNNPGAPFTETDFTLNEFIEMFSSNPLQPAIAGNNLAGMSSNTFADHTTNAGIHGQTVAVHIGWNKVSTPLRVYAVGVSRIS